MPLVPSRRRESQLARSSQPCTSVSVTSALFDFVAEKAEVLFMDETKCCPVCIQLGGFCPDCYCLRLGFTICELASEIERRKQVEVNENAKKY